MHGILLSDGIHKRKLEEDKEINTWKAMETKDEANDKAKAVDVSSTLPFHAFILFVFGSPGLHFNPK